MKRLGKSSLAALVLGAVMVLVPAAPASAGAVCDTTVYPTDWYNERTYTLYGLVGYRCDRNIDTIRAEATVQSLNRTTNRWVDVGQGEQTMLGARSAWAHAYFECGGMSVTTRTKGRGMALYYGDWKDDETYYSVAYSDNCYLSSGIPPLTT